MSDFSVTILGNGSAVPTTWHKPTSQLVKYNGMQFLLDCGEGTQMQMVKYRVKSKNLDHIFITHLHGDHYYGLIGLINSFHLNRREKPLTIFCPEKLKRVIDVQLAVSGTKLNYPLEYRFLKEGQSEILYQDKYLSVSSFPLKHSVAVWGFLFREKEQRRRINKDFVAANGPTIDQIETILKDGGFATSDGAVLTNQEITIDAPKPASYAFCGDTCYLRSTSEYVKGVDILYHESTFDDSREELAALTLHSTARQAAMVAKEAGIGKLLLGHYSARFKADLSIIEEEAREVFQEAYLTAEGEEIIL